MMHYDRMWKEAHFPGGIRPLQSSVRIASVWFEILTWDLLNTEQECSPLYSGYVLSLCTSFAAVVLHSSFSQCIRNRLGQAHFTSFIPAVCFKFHPVCCDAACDMVG